MISVTPRVKASEDCLMMSTKLLESPGTATRTACGKTMCQKPCILVMPQARLASIWAELTEESAPRSVSDM